MINREIEFRGKRKNSSEWIYGGFVELYNRTYILSPNTEWGYSSAEVIPETIGQYTNLKDKNGKKIFEFDDIEFSYDYFTGDFDTKIGKGIVKFVDGIFYIVPYEIEEKRIQDIDNAEWFPLYHVNLEELEVIGNIFDKENKND